MRKLYIFDQYTQKLVMSNTLQIETPTRLQHRLSHSKSIREISQHQSSSQSEKNSSIHTRIRKASAHEFAKEIEEFQASKTQKKKQLRTLQSLQTVQGQINDKYFIDEKDVFLKSRIHDELETHFQRLSKQNSPLNELQKEQLEYTTFRIVKKDEKSHLLELRSKLLPKYHQNKHI